MSKLLKKAMSNAVALGKGPRPGSTKLVNEGLAAQQAGDFGRAATIYGKVLEADPDNFDALHLLGVAAYQTGNPHEAVVMIDRAIALRPDVPEPHSNKSSALMELGRYDEALASCERAIALNPQSAEPRFNAGNALARLNRHEEAVARFSEAVSIKPGFAAAWTNLGGELIDLRRFDEALQALNKAIEADALHAKAHLNRGVALLESRDLAAAEASLRRALELNPKYARARVNLANLALNGGLPSAAISECRAAIASEPTSAEAYNALGNALRASGQASEAVAAYRSAVEAEPLASFHSNLLLGLLGEPTVTQAAILDEALRYGARHAGWTPGGLRRQGAPRRIGFVSADFRVHPVGLFLEPLLDNLEGFETFLYGNQDTHDRQTARLTGLATAWRSTKALTTEEFLAQVRKDSIDVLVDLAGHTAGGRLDVFAQRAAPVQVTWLGYSGTTGLAQFDALIGDPTVTPRSDDDVYSEPIVRLPHSFACLYNLDGLPEVTPLPALQIGSVTFGCFNSTTKVNSEVVALWSRVLQAVPGSQILVKGFYVGDASLQKSLASQFESHGVEPNRVHFLGHSSRQGHWDAFARVDLALDTFPYSGATTTVDNLVMGVPVVTLVGDRYAGRMSSSFLKSAGLTQCLTSSADEFVEAACRLAGDVEALAAMRAGLRGQVVASPLGDAAGFADGFASVIRRVWEEKAEAAA